MNQDMNTKHAVLYLTAAASCADLVLPRKRAECLHMAKRHGLTIAREYADVEMPSPGQLPTELQRLLDDLEQLQDADFVLTYEYFQLSRSAKQLREIDRRIDECGAQLVTIAGLVPPKVLPVRLLPRVKSSSHDRKA